MRILRALLTLSFCSILIQAPLAQTEDNVFFRLNTNTFLETDNPPPGDPDNPDNPAPAASLNYAPQTAAKGDTVTASPIYPNGITPTLFYFQSGSSEADVDPQTGVITWSPMYQAGVHTVTVTMFTGADPNPITDTPAAIGHARLNVESAITVTVSPSSLALELGFESADPVTFTGSASGPAVANPSWYAETNFTGAYDSPDNTFTIFPQEMAEVFADSGSYQLQMVLVDADSPSGDSVISEPVTIEVTGTPYFNWANNSTHANYRVFNDVIFVKRNVAVSIAPEAVNGAATVPATWPAWLDNQMSGATSLPAGLSFNSSGVLVGSTSAAEPTYPISVEIPTRSGNGRYGLTTVQVMPVETLPNEEPDFPPPDSDGDGVPDENDQWPDNPGLPGNAYDDFDGDSFPNGDDQFPDDATRWGMIVAADWWISETGDPEGPMLSGPYPTQYDARQYEFANGQCGVWFFHPRYGIGWYGEGSPQPC